ncbi:MAG: hypothetical protein KC425_14950 [Anaerolineales bacterium]|nr:hypothetical protein [Anaerolineales bacterium]
MSRMLLSFIILLLLLSVSAALAPAAQADVLSGDTMAVSPDTAAVPQVMPAQQEEGGGSGLPEGLSRIFASLGLYIVTMFTMAIGTEIMVDVFKLIVGLRSKPRARETLEEYEKMLPGTLESLGVGAEARHNLEHQLAMLKEVLEPALKAETVVVNLRQRNFNEALAVVMSEEAQAEKVEAARRVARQQITRVFAQLRLASPLGQAVTDRLQDEVAAIIDRAAAATQERTVEDFFAQVAVLVNGRLADAVTGWAETQLNDLQTLSYRSARRIYDQQLTPLIEGAGLSPETERTLKRQFEDFLHNLRTSQEADVYLDAVNKLLLEVEQQRDELASMWRKVLGRIADWLGRYIPLFRREQKQLDPTISTPDDAATKLLMIQRRDKQEDNSRIQQLRLVSVIVGILLAYFLQIDSADLLGDLFPPEANFLSVVLVGADSAVFTWIGQMFRLETHALTAGIVLTGLAASAGSGFWHDQLTRLQTVKKGVETAIQAVQPVIAQQRIEAD